MILYHGTSSMVAKKILEMGEIIPCDANTTHNNTVNLKLRTTYGYVYLTNKIKKALKFGRSRCVHDNSKYVENRNCNAYIFEISIDKDRLTSDEDECGVYKDVLNKEYNCPECNVDNCINNINSVRFYGKLFLKKEVIRYQIWDTRTEKPISEWILI